MKFAALALVGAVSARSFEEDLTEDIRVHYPKEAVAGFMGLGEQFVDNAEAMGRDFHKKHPNFERDMQKFGEWMGKRYGPDLMQWIQSASVRDSEGHKRLMMKTSKELHTVMSDAFTLGNEFAHGGVEFGFGFNKDGSYDEWMSNNSIRHVFEELYSLAHDIRAFIESPMARNQRRLERLTLNDPNFQHMFAKLQDDIDAHTWGQFETRMEQLGHEIAMKMQKCPYMQKAVGILMKMKALCEKTRVVSDMGSEEEWVNWWNEKNFQNPFDGMKPDDFEALL